MQMAVHDHHILQRMDLICSGQTFDDLYVPRALQDRPSIDRVLMLIAGLEQAPCG